jgi:hypothetical protein
VLNKDGSLNLPSNESDITPKLEALLRFLIKYVFERDFAGKNQTATAEQNADRIKNSLE